MELAEAQKQTVRQWAQEGCGLSEIQKKLSGELGISMTFMEVRLLVIDLGIKLQEKSKPAGASLPAGASGAGHTKPDDAGSRPSWEDGQAAAKPDAGGVSIAIDRVTAPGSVVSGTVTFSDGVSATWFLDQLGRLALNPGKPGYTPGQRDVQSFQRELRNVLSKMGY
jgi:hypothetical protein